MNLRVGHGYDIHRLQPGGRLVLAGVEVSDQFSPIAHSDGDVVLHAVVDALLGAAGWGDIGEMFPNNDPRWRGAPSSVFVQTVVQKLRDAGLRIGNIDVTILAERPRLQPFKPQMVERLRQLTGCDVGIKAGTNEGCDAVGSGQAIAAHAVVLLIAGEPSQ